MLCNHYSIISGFDLQYYLIKHLRQLMFREGIYISAYSYIALRRVSTAILSLLWLMEYLKSESYKQNYKNIF